MQTVHMPLLFAFEAILVFQLVYILFQYLFLRRQEYAWYAAYISGILLYTSIMYEQVPLRNQLDKVLPILSYIFYYRFAATFLDLEKTTPGIFKRILQLEKLMIVYIISDFIWKYLGQSAFYGELVFQAVASFLFVCTVTLIVLFLKSKPSFAYFIVSGAIIITAGSVASMLSIILKNKGYPINYDPLLFNNAAVSIELLVFTTGLAYKTRLIEIEKSKLSSSYAKELENNLQLANELSRVKGKIAEEIHQDLGEGISNISVYTGIAEKQAKEENLLLRETLGKIKRISSEMHNSLQDLSWTLNYKNSEQSRLIEKFRQMEREELIPANYKLDIHCQDFEETKQLPLGFSRQAIHALRMAIRLTLQQGLDHPKLILHKNGITIILKKPENLQNDLNSLYGNSFLNWTEDDNIVKTEIRLTTFSD